jgi:hypothetical protein
MNATKPRTPFDDMPNDLDFGAPAQPVNMAKAAKPRFVNVAQQRAHNRQLAAARKVRKAQQSEHAFAEAAPEAWAWIVANANGFEFAASMREAVQRWGGLTEGQLAAVQRCIDRNKARAAEQQRKPAASASLTRLHTVMQKHAKFYAGKLTLSRRNADQLVWIKHADAEKVIGKIDGAALTLWQRPGIDLDYVRAMLAEFEADPLGAAKRFGKLSGRCCSCGRDLTNDGSIDAGIGPICAGKFE